jgi:hypothetical protein
MDINKCLAIYGGTLADAANEADRDGIDGVDSHSLFYNPSGSGAVTATIMFPSTRINSIKFAGYIAGSDFAGHEYFRVYLFYSGGWQLVFTRSCSASSWFSNGTGLLETLSTGWTGVSGIRVYLEAQSFAGVSEVHLREMQAWGPPGGNYACII